MPISLPQARQKHLGHRTLTSTRAGTIASIVLGEGPDVLLVHGITDNADTWRPIQHRLAQRARVHAVDLPGHGLSDIPDRPLKVAEQASAVVAYMEAAGIRQCIVGGNSLGGGVTLGVCHQAPDRVKSAILLGSIGTEFPMPFSLGLLRYRPFAFAMSRVGRTRFTRRLILRDTFHRGFRPSEEHLDEYWRQWRIEGRGRYVRSLLRTIHVSEPTAWLAELRMPIHVLHGEEDRVIPAHVGTAIAAALPNARCTILKGIGHEPQHELPDETCRYFEELLSP